MGRLTTKQFIEQARLKHGDKYDYSKVDYMTAKIKIIIICSVLDHGEFTQTPSNHLTGYGCRKCGVICARAKQTSNTKDFIKKAKEIHGDK